MARCLLNVNTVEFYVFSTGCMLTEMRCVDNRTVMTRYAVNRSVISQAPELYFWYYLFRSCYSFACLSFASSARVTDEKCLRCDYIDLLVAVDYGSI